MRTAWVYAVGLLFMAVSGLAIGRSSRGVGSVGLLPELEPQVSGQGPVVPTGTSAHAWFASIKPFCNTLEAETALRQSRPPANSGFEGPAYEAACLALAGRVDRARIIIGALDSDQQWRAAGVVFEVAHSVADAGDDKSAGPIMAMVADFWPNHYMALYHAGASEYAVGDRPKAREHLAHFLAAYPTEDGWRSNAQAILHEIGR